MKAVYIKEFGGAENLEIRDTEKPKIRGGAEILVRVRAAGVNRADVLQRKGFYPAPAGYPERIPGLEFAGEIAETGKSVTKFAVGERVFGITAGGAQAEFVLTSENELARIPENLSFTEAAAIPEAFITALDAVWTQGKLFQGETLLVHAAGSGVGLAALQIAKAEGIRVFGTSRTPEKLERCVEIGLDVPIDTGENENFAEIVKKKSGGKGADVILDLVGASYFGRNLESLAPGGRLILVGLVGGRKAEFDLSVALRKRLQIIGTVLRSRSAEEKAAVTARFEEKILPLLEEGKIEANLERVFKASEAPEAHRHLEANKNFGKLVLEF